MTTYQQEHSISFSDVFLYLICFFFPPLPVILRVGFWTNQCLLNVLLTMLFGIPGTLHAIYIVYITSPVTGYSEGFVRLAAPDDYERLVENNAPEEPSVQQIRDPQPGQSDLPVGPPPPYEGSRILTDNKVQSRQ